MYLGKSQGKQHDVKTSPQVQFITGKINIAVKWILYLMGGWGKRKISLRTKIPSEMEVAPRYKLFTLL